MKIYTYYEDINVAVFTVHKAASMFIHKICNDISIIKGIDHYSKNYPEDCKFYFPKQQPPLNVNGIFAPLRYHVPVNEKCKKIFHLRDPRDVLTSLYFSNAYSHRIHNEQHAIQRPLTQQMSIDDYVIRRASAFKDRYTSYIQHIDGSTFVKYEDMVTRFPFWVCNFLQPFGFDDVDDIGNYLIDKYQNEFTVESENIYNHKRQIAPGDHKRKLKPQTIDQLNSMFSNVMQVLDYNY